MRGIRVYIDTSIIGGKFDSEFQKASEIFFEQVKEDKFHLIISALVQEEIAAAPKKVKRFFNELISGSTLIEVT